MLMIEIVGAEITGDAEMRLARRCVAAVVVFLKAVAGHGRKG